MLSQSDRRMHTQPLDENSFMLTKEVGNENSEFSLLFADLNISLNIFAIQTLNILVSNISLNISSSKDDSSG